MEESRGLVYKSTGSWYSVCDEQGRYWKARVKGKLKIDKDISSTNPIAVGDNVIFDIEDEDADVGIIKSIVPRDNYIVRVSPHNKHQRHVVAANLDAALVVATITEPRTSQGFIDRFLLSAEAYHIPAIIVINKTDLIEKEKHWMQLAHWKDMYEAAGYEFYTVVALDDERIQPLKNRLANKTTLFSGHSGVGKSTLINQLIPGLEIRTTEVSEWSGKGQHTTTFAEMFDLPDGGRIIDTPGVKEFGLIGFEREELAQYFPEIRALMNNCKFNNCIHFNEPGCAVKKAVVDGAFDEDRFTSYLTILDTVENKW